MHPLDGWGQRSADLSDRFSKPSRRRKELCSERGADRIKHDGELREVRQEAGDARTARPGIGRRRGNRLGPIFERLGCFGRHIRDATEELGSHRRRTIRDTQCDAFGDTNADLVSEHFGWAVDLQQAFRCVQGALGGALDCVGKGTNPGCDAFFDAVDNIAAKVECGISQRDRCGCYPTQDGRLHAVQHARQLRQDFFGDPSQQGTSPDQYLGGYDDRCLDNPCSQCCGNACQAHQKRRDHRNDPSGELYSPHAKLCEQWAGCAGDPVEKTV